MNPTAAIHQLGRDLGPYIIDVTGASSHGAMPERGVDAVVVAAEIVCALQTIVSRNLSPYEVAVITVGKIRGGEASNTVAGTSYLTGTMSGEDFSWYLRKVPGILVFLGTRNEQAGAIWSRRSSRYTIDESVLVSGSMLAAQYAIDYLAQ